MARPAAWASIDPCNCTNAINRSQRDAYHAACPNSMTCPEASCGGGGHGIDGQVRRAVCRDGLCVAGGS